METNNMWQKVRKVLINKYAITLYVFALVFIFVGEQSVINQVSRKIEIRQIRRSIRDIQAQTERDEQLLQSLQHPDSLERFARETYKMHEDGETVFVVE